MRTPFVLAALATLLVASGARADIPPPDDQVKSCVESAITKRIVAKDPSVGPSPCRVVPPFAGTTSPAEASNKRNSAQKSEGYTWICPLTRSYRDNALYCKLPAGMTEDSALHGPDPTAPDSPSAPNSTSAPTPAEATKGRGCGGCATSTQASGSSPLVALGFVGLVATGLAATRRRRR